MCTHCRQVYNPYSRRLVLVKCGKCDSCKQEAALRRAIRIRNNVTDGTIALFVTLTYSNDYVPYVKRSDLASPDLEINVYRNADCRFVYDRHSNKTRLKREFGVHPINRVFVDTQVRVNRDYDCPVKYRLSSLHPLKGLGKDFIGVCHYPDIQEFYKRLRQYLLRDYNYEKSFCYYTCSELGGHTQRPHFHALIFIPRDDETTFRSAILKAWPYADRFRTAKYIEIAKDAASYVSAYVNSGSRLSALFENDSFKPKHSSSKNFGAVLDCFSLSKVLQKIDSGDMVYYSRTKFDGTTNVRKLPIPKYVLHRYFPYCKGFNWLSECQLRTILYDPQKAGDILTDFEYTGFFKVDTKVFAIPVFRECKLANPLYHYSPKESYQIYIRLENCYKRFHRETGLSRFDYVYYYLKVWPRYFAMIERMMHEDAQADLVDYADFYDNNYEVLDNPDIAPTLSFCLNSMCPDPNKRSDVVLKTNNFRSLFSRLCKQKEVTNYVMSENGHYV